MDGDVYNFDAMSSRFNYSYEGRGGSGVGRRRITKSRKRRSRRRSSMHSTAFSFLGISVIRSSLVVDIQPRLLTELSLIPSDIGKHFWCFCARSSPCHQFSINIHNPSETLINRQKIKTQKIVAKNQEFRVQGRGLFDWLFRLKCAGGLSTATRDADASPHAIRYVFFLIINL